MLKCYFTSVRHWVPNVVVWQRHVHVLAHPLMLRVQQLTLRRLQIASEAIQPQQPPLLALCWGLIAPQELQAALGGGQGQTLLRLQEEAQVLRVQTLAVLGQLHHQEVDIRPGAQLTVGLLELLARHVGGQLLLAALDLLEAQTDLWRQIVRWGQSPISEMNVNKLSKTLDSSVPWSWSIWLNIGLFCFAEEMEMTQIHGAVIM